MAAWQGAHWLTIENPKVDVFARLKYVTLHSMDKFLTATEARQHFLRLLDEVREGDRVIITHRGKPTAAVINFERLQLLTDLARLWQDPQSLNYMRAAHEEVRTGRVFRMKGIPTVKRLIALARKKGVLKGRGG